MILWHTQRGVFRQLCEAWRDLGNGRNEKAAGYLVDDYTYADIFECTRCFTFLLCL